MNAVVQHQSSPPSNALMPTNMGDAMRLAEMMARGKMLPVHLQNSPGDCLMVVEQAMRWGMSPFAVAQCTSSIKGKLMFEGKLVAAAIENSGAIQGMLDYQFSGAGKDRKIVVSALRTGETERKTVEAVLKDVETTNDVWKKQPDQQLVYAGVRVWGRRWLPGVMLGVYAPEEFDKSNQPAPAFDGTTIDSVAEPAAVPASTEPKKRTVGDWLGDLEKELIATNHPDAVDAIISREDVQSALDKLKNSNLDALNRIIKTAIDRTNPPDDTAEIDRLAAGYGDSRTLASG